MCSYTNAPKWVLIKVLQHLPQDHGVKNGFKTSQNPINTHLRRELKKKEKSRKIFLKKLSVKIQDLA